MEKAKSRIPDELRGKITFFTANDVWYYRGVFDPKSQCDHCRDKDGKTFLGSSLRQEFPDLEVIDENTIYVNLHMTLWGADTCRCYLWREVPLNVNPEVTVTGEEIGAPESKIEKEYEA